MASKSFVPPVCFGAYGFIVGLAIGIYADVDVAIVCLATGLSTVAGAAVGAVVSCVDLDEAGRCCPGRCSAPR